MIKKITQEIDGNKRVVFVKIKYDEIVGMVDIAWSDITDPALVNLFVIESERRRGIGYELVKSALLWAEDHKTDLWLNVKTVDWLVSWYIRCGFEETVERTNNEENIWMKWVKKQS
jgi:GNAT superfamily N-acetyltransferase